jgi:hypothetical protein
MNKNNPLAMKQNVLTRKKNKGGEREEKRNMTCQR